MIKNESLQEIAAQFAQMTLAEAHVSVAEAIQLILNTLQGFETKAESGDFYAPAQVEYLQACLQAVLDECTEEMAVL